MRHRFRTVPGPSDIAYYYNGYYQRQDGFYSHWPVHSETVTVASSRDDIYDTKDSPYQPHSCTHTKTRTSVDGGVVTVDWGWEGTWNKFHTWAVLGSPLSNFSDLPTPVPALDPYSVVSELDSKMYRFSDTHFDLVSDLLDIGSLLAPVTNLLNLARLVGKRDLGRRPLLEIIGARFGYQWGILPTISDLKALLSWKDQTAKKLAYLKANNGRQTFHAQRVVDYPSVSAPGNVEYSQSCRVVASRPVLFKGDLVSLSAFRLFSDFCGLNRPLDTVWERIPFSFVVDWILNVGDVLSHVQNSLSDRFWVPDGPLVYSTTETTEQRQIARWNAGTPIICGPATQVLPTDVTTYTVKSSFKRYNRVIDYAPLATIPLERGSGLSTHLLDVVSLIAQKIL